MASDWGQYLRDWRIRSGLSIDAIAAETKIPPDSLLKIEAEDITAFPHPAVVTKTYIKAYARSLRLPATEEAALLNHFGAVLDARQREEAEAASLAAAQRGWLGRYYAALVAVSLWLERTWLSVVERVEELSAAVQRTACTLARMIHGELLRLAGVLLQFYGSTRTAVVRLYESTRAAVLRTQASASRRWTALHHAATARIDAWSSTLSRWTTNTAGWCRDRVARSKQAARSAWQESVTLAILITVGTATWCGDRVAQGWHAVRTVSAKTARITVVAVAETIAIAYFLTVGMAVRSGNRLAGGWLTVRIAGRTTVTIPIVAVVRMAAWCDDRLARGRGAIREAGSKAVSIAELMVDAGVWVLMATLVAVLWMVRFTRRVMLGTAAILARLSGRTEGLIPSADVLGSLAVAYGVRLMNAIQHATYLPRPPEPQVSYAGPRSFTLLSRSPSRVSSWSGKAASRVHSHGKRVKRSSMKSWNWVVPYLVALVLAPGLAFILGQAPLFTTTELGEKGLTASHVVQFIGYGGALWLFWSFGLRVAARIPDVPIVLAIARRLLTPLVTLVVLSGAYKVLLLMGEPFFDHGARKLYDWVFVVAIILAAAWMTLAAFWSSRLLTEGAELSETDLEEEHALSTGEACQCPHCSSEVAAGMRFCGTCGSSVG